MKIQLARVMVDDQAKALLEAGIPQVSVLFEDACGDPVCLARPTAQ